jgi:hypothetical protein
MNRLSIIRQAFYEHVDLPRRTPPAIVGVHIDIGYGHALLTRTALPAGEEKRATLAVGRGLPAHRRGSTRRAAASGRPTDVNADTVCRDLRSRVSLEIAQHASDMSVETVGPSRLVHVLAPGSAEEGGEPVPASRPARPCHTRHFARSSTKQLDIVPTQLRVRVTRRPRYGCRAC